MPINPNPPPTYADIVIVDQKTKKAVFNPIWLSWFLQAGNSSTAAINAANNATAAANTANQNAVNAVNAANAATNAANAATATANQAFGANQTQHNVTGSRGAKSTYSNGEPRPILVSVAILDMVGSGGGSAVLHLNGSVALTAPYSASTSANFVFAVPPGWTYEIDAVDSRDVQYWYEYS